MSIAWSQCLEIWSELAAGENLRALRRWARLADRGVAFIDLGPLRVPQALFFSLYNSRFQGALPRWLESATLLTTPSLARQFFRDDDNFRKGRVNHSVEGFLGEAALSGAAATEDVLPIKRTMNRVFTPEAVDGYAASIARHIDAEIDGWGSEPILLDRSCRFAGLRIITEILCGTSLDFAGALVALGALSPYADLRPHVPGAPGLDRIDIPRCDSILREAISDRRALLGAGAAATCLVDHLILHGIDDAPILAQAKNVLLAGAEPVGLSVAWTLHFTVRDAELVRRLRAEIAARVGTRPPSVEDVLSMPLLDCVLKESNRIAPPVPVLSRDTAREVELESGITLPEDTTVFLSPLVQQASPFVDCPHGEPHPWGDDAHEFRPERWLKLDLTRLEKEGHYLRFGAGTRVCPAKYLADVEAKIMLVRVLQRVDLAHVDVSRVAPFGNLTLEVRDLLMSVRRL
jgi:cytochrome P450